MIGNRLRGGAMRMRAITVSCAAFSIVAQAGTGHPSKAVTIFGGNGRLDLGEAAGNGRAAGDRRRPASARSPARGDRDPIEQACAEDEQDAAAAATDEGDHRQQDIHAIERMARVPEQSFRRDDHRAQRHDACEPQRPTCPT